MNKIQFSDSATEVTVRMAKSIWKKGKTPLYIYDEQHKIEYKCEDRTDLNYAIEMGYVLFVKNNEICQK